MTKYGWVSLLAVVLFFTIPAVVFASGNHESSEKGHGNHRGPDKAERTVDPSTEKAVNLSVHADEHAVVNANVKADEAEILDEAEKSLPPKSRGRTKTEITVEQTGNKSVDKAMRKLNDAVRKAVGKAKERLQKAEDHASKLVKARNAASSEGASEKGVHSNKRVSTNELHKRSGASASDVRTERHTKTGTPKQQQEVVTNAADDESEPSSQDVPKRTSPKIPDAILSWFAPGTGMFQPNGERNGHELNPSFWGFAMLHQNERGNGLMNPFVLLQETRYRTQWIHAPPTPPPKSNSFSSNTI
ncbi:MAG TPA: hypothetical protein VFK44_05075 [Bacillales bacterium]|nr:hypothetical protein [Bacillales bacterium]